MTTDGYGSDPPPTGVFLAVYNPPAPSRRARLRTGWRRWYWLHFQEVLGAAVGVLGLTLVLSPVAFIRERRLIARQRVREHLALMRRDAHDKVFNRLSALSKRVAGAGAGLGDDSSAALLAVAEDIRGTVEELQAILGEEVRHTRGALTTMSLAEQLGNVCEAQASRLGIEVECEADADLPDVDPMLGWDLQCIAEEAIANAARHGAATHVRVSVRAEEDALALDVADDGSGTGVLAPEDAPVGSTGLRGIRDRLAARGGTVALELAGGGTVLTARVPLAP
jgi:signal transduction histidine kinase